MKIDATSFATRFHEQPSLIAPHAVSSIEHLVRDSTQKQGEVPYDEMCASAYGFGVTDRSKPFVFSNGIAFIPVHGVLLHKYNYSWEGATGYDYIRARFDAAIGDPSVEGIVFDVNSPGGQVTGNFELADHIFKNRRAKKMMALVDASAYSGGYSLASAVGRIVATPSGGAGSIGVVMMHMSVKRAYEQFGIDINLIYAGAHKVDGSPYRELTDEARQRFQASVDRSYNEFVSLVARNRGLDAEAVRKTEALTYDAKEAKRFGLIDAVEEPISALAAFRKELSGSTISTGGNAMSAETQPEATSNASTNTEESNAVTNEVDQKKRISAILSSDEAKNRRPLAEHLAFNTDMSAEDAKALLAVAGEDKPAEVSAADATNSSFVKAMNEGNHPNVSAAEDVSVQSPGDRIAKTYQQFTGESKK